MRLRTFACALVLAGCGADEPPSGDRPPPPTRLVVEVRPQGERGPVRRRVVTRLPAGFDRRALAPVPPDVACGEIYGGPATARVTGRLNGRPVRAGFDRTDACEIRRWDQAEPLLGTVPGAR